MTFSQKQIEPLALNIEGLLRLLGGTPAERQRYWEILKGITTPAEFRLIESQLELATQLVNVTHASIAAIQTNARAIGA